MKNELVRVVLGTALFALAATTVGCGPSQEELDAELARVRDLQGQLEQARAEQADLQGRVDSILAQNAEMVRRLRALGENVEELEGTRASLQQDLDTTQRALAELRAREAQAQARLQQFRSMLERLRSLIDSGSLRVAIRNGLMVVILEEAILFDSGRADLKSEAETVLTQLTGVLKGIEGRSFQVTGHTDNVPIRSRRFPSNWELSASRAVTVARFMVAQGLEANRISAAGYAETRPLNANGTDEERAANRRIEIALQFNLNELPNLESLDDH